MTDEKDQVEKAPTDNGKRSPLDELRSLTDDLRDMTIESDEAAREARDRRQEIERALRNRRFWVPEQQR